MPPQSTARPSTDTPPRLSGFGYPLTAEGTDQMKRDCDTLLAIARRLRAAGIMPTSQAIGDEIQRRLNNLKQAGS